MTVLYFSSTGNCLYAAKKMGGKCLPIPACIREGSHYFADESVGVVFPVYGLCIPPFIRSFLESCILETDYFFAVATYGFFPGGICSQLAEVRTKNNRAFDYINRLKMAENCITFSDMAKQKGDEKKQERQEKALRNVLEDIRMHRHFHRKDSVFHRFLTREHRNHYEFSTGSGVTDQLYFAKECAGCGFCERICPMENIRMEDGRPVFGDHCVSCGGCLQNCPTGALHHRKEKSGARYRNPHISAEELARQKYLF